MRKRVSFKTLGLLLVCATFQPIAAQSATAVAVRHSEGLVHGFLVLRTLEGDTLADGDLIQVSQGNRVTSKLIFRFKDGSVHDETAVFSQRRSFRLLSDHLVQIGPAFPHPMDVSIDASTGEITDGGDNAEAKTRKTRDHAPRQRAVLHRKIQTCDHTLHR